MPSAVPGGQSLEFTRVLGDGTPFQVQPPGVPAQHTHTYHRSRPHLHPRWRAPALFPGVAAGGHPVGHQGSAGCPATCAIAPGPPARGRDPSQRLQRLGQGPGEERPITAVPVSCHPTSSTRRAPNRRRPHSTALRLSVGVGSLHMHLAPLPPRSPPWASRLRVLCQWARNRPCLLCPPGQPFAEGPATFYPRRLAPVADGALRDRLLVTVTGPSRPLMRAPRADAAVPADPSWPAPRCPTDVG